MKVSRVAQAGPDKHDLIQWAAKRRELDLVSKTILKSLAYFAMDGGDTWATVETLADEANCSVRTVQYRLRALADRGYLADTGRTWRLKNSTRCVPLYLLQPSLEWMAEAVSADVSQGSEAAGSMGANPAPIDGAWVQTQAGMGATVCTRKDHLGSPETSDEVSLCARDAVGELYGRIEGAYPRRGLGSTRPDVARAALADLIGQGVDGEGLVAAAVAYAADPAMAGRKFGPPGVQVWLAQGQYRSWMPEAEPAGVAPWAGPSDLWMELFEALGEVAAKSLIRDRTSLDGRRVLCASAMAFRHLSPLAGIFEKHGFELVAPEGSS